MEDLIKRKQEEKEKLISFMKSCENMEDLKKAQQAYLELDSFDLINPIKEQIGSDIISICDGTIDNDFMNFALDVINIFSSMPLLETETYIEYPNLRNTKKVSDEKIRNYWNKIFEKEANTTLFTEDNTIFIRPSFIKSIYLNEGKFSIYRNYLTDSKTLILHRFNSPRDFVNPYFIQMSNYVKQSNYSNILGYYMQGRSIQGLNIDRTDLTCTYYDQLVFKARILKDYINQGNISAAKRLEIIDFADKVIGLILTNEKTTLEELAKYDSLLNAKSDCYKETMNVLEEQKNKMKKYAI